MSTFRRLNMADKSPPSQASFTFGVRWSDDLSVVSEKSNLSPTHDLRDTWKLLAEEILKDYGEFELLGDYLPMIERKINETLRGGLESESNLMILANQLEDLLNAMDIDKSLRSSPLT